MRNEEMAENPYSNAVLMLIWPLSFCFHYCRFSFIVFSKRHTTYTGHSAFDKGRTDVCPLMSNHFMITCRFVSCESGPRGSANACCYRCRVAQWREKKIRSRYAGYKLWATNVQEKAREWKKWTANLQCEEGRMRKEIERFAFILLQDVA